MTMSSCRFDEEWRRCWPFLERAAAMSGTHTEADVRAACLAERMRLWPGFRSAAVTEIVAYPHERVLRFFLAGGDLEELRVIEGFATQWARDSLGCAAAEIVGRAGWERALGYDRVAVLMRRPLP